MTMDSTAVNLGSLSALREAFRAAPEPVHADLVGVFDAQFVGPFWLRSAGPTTMRLGRMAGWCGKRFEADDDGDGVLQGSNRVRREATVSDSVPMTARLTAARLDGRPALVVSYPGDAPFPWPRVTDEFRPFGDGTLLGLTFGIPLAPPGGTPFLLHRVG